MNRFLINLASGVITVHVYILNVTYPFFADVIKGLRAVSLVPNLGMPQNWQP